MALRLVEIYRPDDKEALSLPDDGYDTLGHWTYSIDDGQRVDRVLLEVEETETFLDWVDQAISSDYRVVLQSVEATLPRPEIIEEEKEKELEPEEAADRDETSVGRISREELYQYARDASDISTTYFALVALSMIVAAGGMLRDQTAVVIGAMVIAPLIGPNLALALGTTLGDTTLLGQSLWANVSGALLVLSGAFVLGLVVPVDPTVAELSARTVISPVDVGLAAAAGAAGSLSVSRGGATGLVGVMVAVALLPPLVATGLLLGAGYFEAASQAGLLTVCNVVSLNLSAVCTYLILGLEPRSWIDVERARTSTRIALTLWGGALLVLLAILWFTG